MGYRSDVRITMSKNGYKEFQRYVKEHIDDYKSNNIKEGTVMSYLNYDFNLLHNLIVNYELKKENIVYIGWNNLKWYDGFEEVDSIMDSLKKLRSNGYGYCFSRIGEAYDDVENIYVDITDKDSIKNIESPQLIREFDDSYFEKRAKELLEDKQQNSKNDINR